VGIEVCRRGMGTRDGMRRRERWGKRWMGGNERAFGGTNGVRRR